MIETRLKMINGHIWKRFYYKNKSTDYLVSEYGEVYSEKSNKFMKSSDDGNGYLKIKLMVCGKSVHKKIHQLVCESFNVIIMGDANQINHIDGDRKNNHYRNLEWCTSEYNNRHSAYKLRLTKYDNDTIIKAIRLMSNEMPLSEISQTLDMTMGIMSYIRREQSYYMLKDDLGIDNSKLYYGRKKELRGRIQDILNRDSSTPPLKILEILRLEKTDKNLTYIRDRKKKHIKRMQQRSTTRES